MLRDCCQREDGRVAVTHEPELLHHGERVEGAEIKKTRADIAITLPNGDAVLIDTSIAKPNATLRPLSASIDGAGAAADERVKTKMTKYNKNWKLRPGTKIIIASFEAGGRWHPGLANFVKRYIKASCGNDVKTYVHKLKATTQRVSVARCAAPRAARSWKWSAAPRPTRRYS